MEDIWKDITLTGTTLQGPPSSKHRDPNTGIFFQDLLSSTPSNHQNPINEITAVEFSLFPSTPPMQRPNTALNLNSAPEKSHYQPEATDELNHRRHKRMIKNREAASRSRARKQVYSKRMKWVVTTSCFFLGCEVKNFFFPGLYRRNGADSSPFDERECKAKERGATGGDDHPLLISCFYLKNKHLFVILVSFFFFWSGSEMLRDFC